MYANNITTGTMRSNSRFHVPNGSNQYGYLVICTDGFSSLKIESDVTTVFYTLESGTLVSHNSAPTSKTHDISNYDGLIYRATGTACYVTFS